MMAYREFSSHEKFSFQMMLEKLSAEKFTISSSKKDVEQIRIEVKNGEKSVIINL